MAILPKGVKIRVTKGKTIGLAGKKVEAVNIEILIDDKLWHRGGYGGGMVEGRTPEGCTAVHVRLSKK